MSIVITGALAIVLSLCFVVSRLPFSQRRGLTFSRLIVLSASFVFTAFLVVAGFLLWLIRNYLKEDYMHDGIGVPGPTQAPHIPLVGPEDKDTAV